MITCLCYVVEQTYSRELVYAPCWDSLQVRITSLDYLPVALLSWQHFPGVQKI